MVSAWSTARVGDDEGTSDVAGPEVGVGDLLSNGQEPAGVLDCSCLGSCRGAWASVGAVAMGPACPPLLCQKLFPLWLYCRGPRWPGQASIPCAAATGRGGRRACGGGTGSGRHMSAHPAGARMLSERRLRWSTHPSGMSMDMPSARPPGGVVALSGRCRLRPR
jgi:hypothetical protein